MVRCSVLLGKIYSGWAMSAVFYGSSAISPGEEETFRVRRISRRRCGTTTETIDTCIVHSKRSKLNWVSRKDR